MVALQSTTVKLTILESSPGRAPAIAGLENGPRSIGAVKVLRLSITDRCNFRCVYCMPADGVRWLAHEQILSFEEICDVVRSAIEFHGIQRFKLTGGEPTVRHGLVELVGMLRRIPGIEDLSLTTNGQRMDELAYPLRQAGLDRVTISIDSLLPEKFHRITRTGNLCTVLKGLDRCEEVGFDSVKINCVTMRGVNDDELADFARLTLCRRLSVRFIEYMPLGDSALMDPDESSLQSNPSAAKIGGRLQFAGAVDRGGNGGMIGGRSAVAAEELGPAGGCGAQDRGADSLIPEAEVRQLIARQLGPLVPVDPSEESGVGPARMYQLAWGNPVGRIGFISAMSAPFCATCNRLRLTANGVLRSCLFDGGEVDVRTILRENPDPATRRKAVAQAMVDCVRLKPAVHSRHGNEQMSRIGG